MLKKIYEFIDDNIRGNDLLQIILFFIGWFVLFLVFFTCVFDYTPATDNDYAPLMNQKDLISENFNNVYDFDNYEIAPQNKDIIVTLSSDQCEVLCTFNSNHELTNLEKLDSAMHPVLAIFISIFMGFIWGGFIFLFIIAMLIPFLISYALKILEWICLLLTR